MMSDAELEDAYRTVAPKALVAELDRNQQSPDSTSLTRDTRYVTTSVVNTARS
jgi:hypothetical protein